MPFWTRFPRASFSGSLCPCGQAPSLIQRRGGWFGVGGQFYCAPSAIEAFKKIALGVVDVGDEERPGQHEQGANDRIVDGWEVDEWSADGVKPDDECARRECYNRPLRWQASSRVACSEGSSNDHADEADNAPGGEQGRTRARNEPAAYKIEADDLAGDHSDEFVHVIGDLFLV